MDMKLIAVFLLVLVCLDNVTSRPDGGNREQGRKIGSTHRAVIRPQHFSGRQLGGVPVTHASGPLGSHVPFPLTGEGRIKSGPFVNDSLTPHHFNSREQLGPEVAKPLCQKGFVRHDASGECKAII